MRCVREGIGGGEGEERERKKLKSKGVSKCIGMGKCIVWKGLLEMLAEGAIGGELRRGNV